MEERLGLDGAAYAYFFALFFGILLGAGRRRTAVPGARWLCGVRCGCAGLVRRDDALVAVVVVEQHACNRLADAVTH